MKTVDKTMRLLSYFTPSQPEIGLSELARLAEMDKATTRRILMALNKHHFIEQNQITKAYRLGSGFLHLARVREATTPITAIASQTVDWLCDTTRETAHASVASPNALITIAHKEPHRGTVVMIDPTEPLPFHATASGIVFMAFNDTNFCENVLKKNNWANTQATPKQTRLFCANASNKRAKMGFISTNTGSSQMWPGSPRPISMPMAPPQAQLLWPCPPREKPMNW